MDVSVIIPTYNRASMVRRALKSVVAQRLGDDATFEVIVVDNASTDDTRQVVEEVAQASSVPVRYVFEREEGVAPARNRGLREARGTWLAFLDDDECAQEGWLRELRDVAKSGDAQFVGGAVHLDATSDQLEGLGPRSRRHLRERTAASLGGEPRPMRAGELPGTDNMLVARAAAEALGGFDESFVVGGEDHDFAIRGVRAGHAMWVAPGAVVLHAVPPGRLTPAYFRKDAMQGGSLQAYFTWKYESTARMVFDLLVRSAHGVIVVGPALVWARLRADRLGALDRQVRIWRAKGYALRAATLLAPRVFSEQRLLEELDFRQSRALTGAAAE